MKYSKITGSENILVSTANQDIAKVKKTGDTYHIRFKAFQFFNYTDCTVIVNNNDPIFVPAGFGILIEEFEITSFIIKEKDVKFVWTGGY